MRLDNLLEKLPSEICLFNVGDLRIIQANQRVRENLGYTMAELEKLTFPDLADKLDKQVIDRLTEPIRRAAEENISFSANCRRKDGTLYPARIHLHMGSYESSQVFIAAIAEVSNRQKNVGIARVDQDHMQLINRFLSISLEQPCLKDVLGKFIELVVTAEWLNLEPKGAIFLVDEEPSVLALKASRGLDDSILSACRKIPFGKCVCGQVAETCLERFCRDTDQQDPLCCSGGLYGCCLPITSDKDRLIGVFLTYPKQNSLPEKKTSRLLTTICSLLAAIIERRWAEEKAKSLAEQLRENSRLRGDFISAMTHELRTPLTIFRSIVSNALSGVYGKTSPKLCDQLHIADESIDRLARIISDLMDVSQIDADKKRIELRKVSIQSIVSDAVATLKPIATVKKVKLVAVMPDRELFVHADRQCILQVLTNLLAGAVRSAWQADSQVAVRVKNLGDRISVEIEDDSRADQNDEIEKVFRHFVRITDQMDSYGNIPTELTVCRDLIKQHHGRIWLENAPGDRTIFCFDLPQYGATESDLEQNTDEKTDIVTKADVQFRA